MRYSLPQSSFCFPERLLGILVHVCENLASRNFEGILPFLCGFVGLKSATFLREPALDGSRVEKAKNFLMNSKCTRTTETDDIVCSTGSSAEGEPDPLDPPVDPNKEEWLSRYSEHVRRRAAGELGPIKTIPKLRTTPIRPAGPIPALDTKFLVTSKVLLSLAESATVPYSVVGRQSPGPRRRRHRPAKVTAEPSKVRSACLHARMVSFDDPERGRLVQASLRAHSRRFKPLTISACKPCKPVCVCVSAAVR